MTHLPQPGIFFWRTINLNFMYLFAPFIRAQNSPFTQKKIFGKIIKLNFIYLSAPFIMQKFKNILREDPDLWRRAIFRPKWPICPKWGFFWKTINISSIYLWAPFIVQNFKKILRVDPELWGCAIFGLLLAHLP